MLTDELIQFIYAKLGEDLNLDVWADPEIQARWGEIEQILDTIRQGLMIGNAELPPATDGPHEYRPYLAKWRCIVKLFLMESRMLESNGDAAGATEGVLQVAHFATEFPRGAGLLGGVTGINVTKEAVDEIQRAFRGGTLPSQQYSNIIGQLQEIATIAPDRVELLASDLNGMEPWLLQQIEPGADVDISIERLREVSSENYWDPRLETMAEEEFRSLVEDFIERQEIVLEYMQRPLHEMTEQEVDEILEENPLSRIFVPSPIAVAGTAALNQTRLNGTALIAAVEWYAFEHEEYPPGLDALTPRYIGSLPVDPFTGQSFRYINRGQDYVLYSAGGDCVDNGGVPGVSIASRTLILSCMERNRRPEHAHQSVSLRAAELHLYTPASGRGFSSGGSVFSRQSPHEEP